MLVCGIKMAERAGDKGQADAWRAMLRRGQESYERKLWTGLYYRTYHDTNTGRRNDACFSAHLSSVWCTRVLGLRIRCPRSGSRSARSTRDARGSTFPLRPMA